MQHALRDQIQRLERDLEVAARDYAKLFDEHQEKETVLHHI
jgi:hypothetical protein